MSKILEQDGGDIKFSNEVQEYILDENMELKAIRLKNGVEIDHKRLHRDYSPKHPLLRTPENLKSTLDQFFLHEFKAKRVGI